MNTPSLTGSVSAYTGIPSLPDPPINSNHHIGTPTRWEEQSNSKYLQNRVGHYLEIHPDGAVRGNPGERTIFGIILLLSYVTGEGNTTKDNIAIKGYASNLYLCMNNRSILYARKNVPCKTCRDRYDCAFTENLLPNNHDVYFHSYYKEKRQKFYIGIDRNGRLKPGIYARKSQNMSQFLPVEVPLKKMIEANKKRDSLNRKPVKIKVTSRSHSYNPGKRRKNENRRRRRRWCSKIKKIKKNPQKYIERCKHHCEILRLMIQNFPRHRRRCVRDSKRRRTKKNSQRHRIRHRAHRSIPHGDKKRGHRRKHRKVERRHKNKRREGRWQRHKRLLKQNREKLLLLRTTSDQPPNGKQLVARIT